jgi:hypothetical protein
MFEYALRGLSRSYFLHEAHPSGVSGLRAARSLLKLTLKLRTTLLLHRNGSWQTSVPYPNTFLACLAITFVVPQQRPANQFLGRLDSAHLITRTLSAGFCQKL